MAFGVLAETATSQVASGNALERYNLGLGYEDRPAFQHVGVSSEVMGEVLHIDRDEVVRNHFLQTLEPEVAQLGEDLTLVGNAWLQDVVVGGDPIASNDEKKLAEVVDIADLASSWRRKIGDLCFPDRF